MNVRSMNATMMPAAQRLGRVELGPKAEGVGSTVGRIVGTSVRTSLNAHDLLRDSAIGGATNIPFQALFDSQRYRRGELKANEYVGNMLGTSIGFGMWTIGGAVAGAALAPLGLPALAVGIIGFAAGMTSQDLFDRFLGNQITKAIAGAIPEKAVKPFCDGFTKYIAYPLHDHLWKPVIDAVKGHKVLAGAAAGLLALKFPTAAKVIGREALTMGGGMAAGMGISMGILNPVLGPSEAPFEKSEADTAVKPEWVTAFKGAVAKLQQQGATPAQAQAAAKQFFVKNMLQNGAKQEEAQELVEAIAQAAAKPQASTPRASGTARPAGMLMGR